MLFQLVVVRLVQYVSYPTLSARIILEQLGVMLANALERCFLHLVCPYRSFTPRAIG